MAIALDTPRFRQLVRGRTSRGLGLRAGELAGRGHEPSCVARRVHYRAERWLLTFGLLLVIASQAIGQETASSTASSAASTATDRLGASRPADNGKTAQPSVTANWRESAPLAVVRWIHPLRGHLGCGVIVGVSPTGFDVITANHVLPTADFCQLVWRQVSAPGQLPQERVTRSFQIMEQDPATDLAYVRVSLSNTLAHRLSLAPATPAIAQPPASQWTVVQFSDAGQLELRAVQGIVRQAAKRSSDAPPVSYWRLNSPSVAGMSGGPLLDDQGRLIGIASGNSHDQAFYADDRELARFFSKAGLER
jgi:S1-C subfamily serine protease